MADKDFATCADWTEFVPTLTERDEAALWRLIESAGIVYEPAAAKAIHAEWDRTRNFLRDQRWALKSNLRRIELERVLMPIHLGSRCDYTGVDTKDYGAKIKVETEHRNRLIAEAGLTPEQYKQMDLELGALNSVVVEAESAYEGAEQRRENYDGEAARYANAVCYSEGKREGFRAGMRHLLMDRAALESTDMLARLMMAMLDDRVADRLIADLTEHDAVPLWPDDKDEADKFFHGADSDQANEE